MTNDNQYELWLRKFLASHGGVAGTVHLYAEGALELAAAVNIPPPVAEAVKRVPSGKGMAGLALERKQPIQTCNLKDDQSGNVRPGAKAVNAQAAVAIPVEDGTGSVVSVVGIAFAHKQEFTPDELDKFSASADNIRSLL